MSHSIRGHLSRRFILFLVVPAILGCGEGGMGGVSPPAQGEARDILDAVLGAWKRGQVKGLALRQPPIRLVDPDLEAGCKLGEYRIEDTAEPVGAAVDIPVELSLTDRKGKARSVKAVYQVTTVPNVAVLRNDP